LPITLIEYGINTLRKSISPNTLRLSETIIITRISICISSSNNWRTGRDSKGQSRELNITSLTKFPTKIVAYRNL